MLLFWWELFARALSESLETVGGTSGAIILWFVGAVVSTVLVWVFRSRGALIEHLKANIAIVIAGAVATWLFVFAWKLAWLPYEIGKESGVQPRLTIYMKMPIAPLWALERIKTHELAPRRTVEISLVTGVETASMGEEKCGAGEIVCYGPNDFTDKPISLFVGEKGWTRLVYRVRNVGSVDLLPPSTQLISKTPGLLVQEATAHDPNPNAWGESVVYSEHRTTSLLAKPKGRKGVEYQFPFDLGLARNITEGTVSFAITGPKLPLEIRETHFLLIVRKT